MKKTTKAKVNKSLTPEEKTILGNIRSLLEQLDSEEISEDMDAPAVDEVEASADEEEVGDEIIDEEEEVEKACEDDKVKKSSTPDEVANNNAEQRLTAEDKDTEEALAVLKSLLRKSKGNKAPVQKSADIVRIEKKVDDLTDAVAGMLEGFGLARRPVRKSTQLMDRLEALVNKSERHDGNDGTLSDVMTTLFRG